MLERKREGSISTALETVCMECAGTIKIASPKLKLSLQETKPNKFNNRTYIFQPHYVKQFPLTGNLLWEGLRHTSVVLLDVCDRWSVGSTELPLAGSRPPKVLHTLYDRRRWQPSLVWLQEQSAHHQPSGNEYRGQWMGLHIHFLC